MFIWMTTLFTLLISPFTFIVGRPKQLTTTGKFLTPHFRTKFPWSSKTPVLVCSPWPWFDRFMEKKGVNAYAFSGFFWCRVEQRSTLMHESIHVTHQSVVSPVLYALAYMLDWIVFAPFKSWFDDGEYKRAPVAEKVAYRVVDQELSR